MLLVLLPLVSTVFELIAKKDSTQHKLADDALIFALRTEYFSSFCIQLNTKFSSDNSGSFLADQQRGWISILMAVRHKI